MAYDYKALEVKRIPLANLVIGKGHVRKRHVSKDISELVESIRAVGQLHPIIVCESSDQPGKFEILTGQRRFLACQELGQKDIWAMILDRPITEEEAKVISLTESRTRQPLDKKDLIDALMHLYKLYGNIETIVEKTGLSASKVRQHIKYAALSPELKEMVDKGSGSDGVDLRTALRVQTALEKLGEVTPDVAVALAKKMQGMTGAQQEKAIKEVERGGVTTVEKIYELMEAIKKTPTTLVELRFKLFPEQSKALNNYAKGKGMKLEDAVKSLITDALESMGYLEEPEE